MFSGVDVTVVLFVTLRLDEDVVAGSVEITVLDSDVDVVDRVVVVFALANLMSVSSSFIWVDVSKTEVVLGNFWPNRNLAVVPFETVLFDTESGLVVLLGLVDFLTVVVKSDEGDVVFVFCPNGINSEAVWSTIFSICSSTFNISLAGFCEASGTRVGLVLAPNAIPTELAIARGGFTF